jgi:uncharacterized Ntn-hydrolase superfamily protein
MLQRARLPVDGVFDSHPPMTWSIVARDASGAFGVAISSKFFAVGALCRHVRRSVGAAATQALVNPMYGAAALDALARGCSPEEAIAQIICGDEGREHRQIHLIGAAGAAAVHTGTACVEWCGHTIGDGFSVAGNMLAGPQVVEQTVAAYRSADPGLPFAERLIAALEAGEAAGGDKRGKQSAALLIYTTEDYSALDIRVDDHAEPLQELRRLYGKSLERYQPFISCLPSRARPAGITDRAVIESEIEHFQARRSGRAQ